MADQRYSSWMGDHWEALASRTLISITLPGSHNSGNIQGKLKRPTWDEDQYLWNKFQDYLSRQGVSNFQQDDFDAGFIPWNINHNIDLRAQLDGGMRFLHFKILKQKSSPFSLQETFHQHRGFVAENLLSTLVELKDFLEKNPKEIILIGLNNINGFSEQETQQLQKEIINFWKEEKVMTAEDLYSTKLETLVQQGRRVGLFMENSFGPKVISTEEHLHEQWDPSGHSGNTKLFSEFLVQDMKKNATEGKHFYVLQGNPNNNQEAMFESVMKKDGQSLESWQKHFIQSIKELVLKAISEVPQIRINAINTDFQEVSMVTQMALALSGL